MPCNSEQTREQKTRCLRGVCNPVQCPATTDRTLVAGAGQRFESARRLFVFPHPAHWRHRRPQRRSTCLPVQRTADRDQGSGRGDNQLRPLCQPPVVVPMISLPPKHPHIRLSSAVRPQHERERELSSHRGSRGSSRSRRCPDGRRWRPRRSGRAQLSSNPLHFSLTRSLTGEPGPEQEDSNSEGSQCREQADRDVRGEPEDDKSDQGCYSTDERVWDLCRGVIDEVYARPYS
jgi:hypothetical protein